MRVIDIVWPNKEVREMKQEAQGSVTDKVMRRTVELGVQVHDIQRNAEKVDRVASPSQPPTKKDQNKIQPLGDTTYPERKRPHCVQVRLLRTSHNGLVRSTFSFFGRRFRRKYGAIEAIYIEGSSTRGETEGEWIPNSEELKRSSLPLSKTSRIPLQSFASLRSAKAQNHTSYSWT